jgi:hypothetical protein
MGSQSEAMKQMISVSRSGEALHGIGEKFVPDSFTGDRKLRRPDSSPSRAQRFQPASEPCLQHGKRQRPVWIKPGPLAWRRSTFSVT